MTSNEQSVASSSTIKSVTETYWTNRFGGRFSNSYAAEEDEKARLSARWQLKVIGTRIGETAYPASCRSKPYRAIDDSKAPFTGQPDGTSTVYLLTDKIAALQALVDKHGPMVGETTHHCGMGNHSTELCILSPFDGAGRPTATDFFDWALARRSAI